jgi:hypothetical protein
LIYVNGGSLPLPVVLLHKTYTMTSKTKNHLAWIPSMIVGIFMTTSAALKLLHAPLLATLYAKIGFETRMTVFAITELVLLGLFLWPRTLKIGLLLLTGYYGGAMAIEVSINGAPFVPATILATIWLAGFFRNASVFITPLQKRKLASL